MKPEWIKELFRRHWLRLALLYSVPLLAGFALSTLSTPAALGLWAASSALLAYAALALEIRAQMRAQQREAGRLGYRIGLKGSAWNPWRWFREGLELDFPPPSTPKDFARRAWDEPLLSSVGPWIHERFIRLEHKSRWDFNVASCLLGVLTFLVVPTQPAFRWCGVILALCALALWTRLWIHEELRLLVTQDTWMSPLGDVSYRSFEEAHHERLARHSSALADILTRRAGLASGSAVLELGAGSCLLHQFLPPHLRQGWLQSDLQLHPLRFAQSRGRGDRWVQLDAGRLPFANESLTAAVGVHFLDSLEPQDMEAALHELARALKTGGVLVHLADFEELPGPKLAWTLNQLSPKEAVVSYDPASKRLRCERVSVEGLRLLRETLPEVASRSEAPVADRAAWLLETLVQGGLAEELEEPRRAFLSLLVRACRRHGLRIADAGRTKDPSAGLAYLIAFKP